MEGSRRHAGFRQRATHESERSRPVGVTSGPTSPRNRVAALRPFRSSSAGVRWRGGELDRDAEPPAGRGVRVRVPSCAWAMLRTNRRTIRLITGTSGRAWPMRYSPDRLRRERISPPSTARESTPATTAAHSRRTPRSLPATVRGSPTRRSTSAKLSRRGHGRAGAVRARRGHHFSGVSTSTPPRSSKPRTWTSRISPVGISSWRTSGSPWANRCSSNDSSPCGTLSWMGSAITIPVPGDRATSAHCGMWCIRAAPGPQGCARTSARSRLFSGRLIGHWQGYRHKS